MKVLLPFLFLGLACVSFADVQPLSPDQREGAYSYLDQECDLGHLDSVKDLVARGLDVHQSYLIGRGSKTALHRASLAGHADIVQYLIEHGSDVNAVGGPVNALGTEGETPLMCACREGHLDCVKLLLDAGAKVELKDKFGRTVLYCACFRSEVYAQIFDLLIAHGANAKICTADGYTPLMEASYRDALHQALYLMEKGLDVNSQTDEGYTALMMSCIYGWKNLIAALLEHGADINLKNDQGETAHDIAVRRNHRGGVFDLLVPTAPALKGTFQNEH